MGISRRLFTRSSLPSPPPLLPRSSISGGDAVSREVPFIPTGSMALDAALKTLGDLAKKQL